MSCPEQRRQARVRGRRDQRRGSPRMVPPAWLPQTGRTSRGSSRRRPRRRRPAEMGTGDRQRPRGEGGFVRPVLMRFSSSGSIRSPASAQRMAASSRSASPGGRPDSDPRIGPNYETGLQRSGNDRPELGQKSHGRSPNRSTGLATRRWRRQGESTWKSTGLRFGPVGNAALSSAVTVATKSPS